MNGDGDLIDPALLEGLTEEQRQEALAAAEAAQRAEQRAEQRALERALKRKEEERQRFQQPAAQKAKKTSGLVFVPKRKREQNQEDSKVITNGASLEASAPPPRSSSYTAASRPPPSRAFVTTATPNNQVLSDRERQAVKATYLGKSEAEKEKERLQKRQKQKVSKKITFKFRWDDTDDTFQEDDPLYASMPTAAQPSKRPKKSRSIMSDTDDISTIDRARSKPLDKMTSRDWRIFRENYEISVRGGRAPPPLRSFRETPAGIPPLHNALLDAIENVMRFKEPSPIQRQSIPIGLQRRDLIGIAETGSGKTVAFGVPLCHYILNLPKRVLNRVADDGPLALIMAPTRELALQIEIEISKLLSRQSRIKTCPIVGGQSIQQQAQQVRKGVHIVVGTPGRINDCIESAYLVLNQCCYIVLDEADRMVDMGFISQIQSILDSMGGKLKSAEDEAITYQQEQEDLNKKDVASYRITAMFSATMPLEVERIAKDYLRYPAIVSIGDQDSVKNARITQKIVWLASPGQKEKALRDQINNPRYMREKVIVFVNEKKHADSVGRMVERAGRKCVVLHGGKSQEQREENLDMFRRGGIVMVATDVAGRGLDIPDVAHVINYDLPTRSIENYTHRIGRTGRAGKDGQATSFITDEDEGIMADLKKYLESTGNEVPARLARHPAASGNVQSNLIF